MGILMQTKSLSSSPIFKKNLNFHKSLNLSDIVPVYKKGT